MILLQIILIPGVILFMLTIVLVASVAGTENPRRTNTIDQEVTWINAPDTLWSANSKYQPTLTLRSHKRELNWIDHLRTELLDVNPPIETLPLVSIEKYPEEK